MANLSCTDGLVAVKCGGNWNDGVHCGARTVNMNDMPWNVNVNTGVRLACDERKSIKKRNAPLITVKAR